MKREKKKTRTSRTPHSVFSHFYVPAKPKKKKKEGEREREKIIRKMGSSPPQSESPSPPQSGRGSRSYTPALLDMFNNNSNGGGGGESGETPKSGGSKNDGENNTFSSSGSRPNSDSKPPRHASFNFQIQSKNNNSINGESTLQPLPLIKDQLQVVEVTRNGRARKVSTRSRSGFLFSFLLDVFLLKTLNKVRANKRSEG